MVERTKIKKKPFRLISEEPVITETLEAWQPILPRPLREQRLQTLKMAEKTLRSTQFKAGMIVNMFVYGAAIALEKALKPALEARVESILGGE